MEQKLGINIFLTLYPPKGVIDLGKFKLSAGNETIETTRTTNSGGQTFNPTVNLDYENVDQDEVSKWVLFHSFVTNDTRPMKTYMHTFEGVISFKNTPFGREQDYEDFIKVLFFPQKLTKKLKYTDLYKTFVAVDEKKLGLVKNYLLDLVPGRSYQHSEMADYSYWKLVIYFSIVDSIIGEPKKCSEQLECPVCKKNTQHYSISAEAWLKQRLEEIIGKGKTAEQYFKTIWAVRQKVRHSTVHTSAYPTSTWQPLFNGDNVYDADMAISVFKTDTHALSALVSNMKDVTRFLLLNEIFQFNIYPDFEPYMIRAMGGPTRPTQNTGESEK